MYEEKSVAWTYTNKKTDDKIVIHSCCFKLKEFKWLFPESLLPLEILNCVPVQEKENSGTDAASTDAAGQGYEVGTNAAEQRQSGECRHHCRLHFRLPASPPSESDVFLLFGAYLCLKMLPEVEACC